MYGKPDDIKALERTDACKRLKDIDEERLFKELVDSVTENIDDKVEQQLNADLKESAEYDFVNQVKHYEIFKGIEAKDIIEHVLDSNDLCGHLSGFEKFCLGNVLKYRLRAGNKDNLEQEIAKADRYKNCLK